MYASTPPRHRELPHLVDVGDQGRVFAGLALELVELLDLALELLRRLLEDALLAVVALRPQALGHQLLRLLDLALHRLELLDDPFPRLQRLCLVLRQVPGQVPNQSVLVLRQRPEVDRAQGLASLFGRLGVLELSQDLGGEASRTIPVLALDRLFVSPSSSDTVRGKPRKSS